LTEGLKPEFSISTLSLRENHAPAARSCQPQIALATVTVGGKRGSFGSSVDLLGLVLASSQLRR